MVDHDKLRDAIRKIREHHSLYWVNGRPNLSTHAFLSDAEVEALVTAAESTLPRTKMVETYHVEYTVWVPEFKTWEPRVEVCGDKVLAEVRALGKRDLNSKSAIRVTGPFQQEVPSP